MSPILSGELKVPFLLAFLCKEKRVIDTMEEFEENFVSFEYSGNLHSADVTNDNDDQEDNSPDATQTNLDMEYIWDFFLFLRSTPIVEPETVFCHLISGGQFFL